MYGFNATPKSHGLPAWVGRPSGQVQAGRGWWRVHVASGILRRISSTRTGALPTLGRPLQVLGIVIASVVLVLLDVAILLSRPGTASPAPGEAIDRFVAVARAKDVDVATALLDNGATTSDSGRNVPCGSEVATRVFANYGGYDAGPRHVCANQDTHSRLQYLNDLYAAALAAETSGYQGFIAPQGVPGTADVQVMCPLTESQFTSDIGLAAEVERSCPVAEPASGVGVPWMPVVAASITSLLWLAHSIRARQPTTGRRPFIQALGAWHTSMVEVEPTGPSDSPRPSARSRTPTR